MGIAIEHELELELSKGHGAQKAADMRPESPLELCQAAFEVQQPRRAFKVLLKREAGSDEIASISRMHAPSLTTTTTSLQPDSRCLDALNAIAIFYRFRRFPCPDSTRFGEGLALAGNQSSSTLLAVLPFPVAAAVVPLASSSCLFILS